MNPTKNQYKPAFDIFKFILALSIVSIHTNALIDFSPFLNDLFCKGYARLAVPLFFIISGYFLYRKEENKVNLKRYCSRIFKLYLFYFILFFPMIIDLRYLNCGSNYPLLTFILFILFCSSFRGSWYLNASILAPIIIFWKKDSKCFLIILSIILYVFTTLYARYGLVNILPLNGLITQILPPLANTVLIAIPYFVLARYVVNTKKEDLFLWNNRQLGLVISLILLTAEIIFCHYNFPQGNDCYFLLLPASYFIFIILDNLNLDLNINKEKLLFMRKSSTLIYIWHFVVLELFIILSIQINNLILYFLVTMITIMISFIIIRLSDKIKLLKYAY